MICVIPYWFVEGITEYVVAMALPINIEDSYFIIEIPRHSGFNGMDMPQVNPIALLKFLVDSPTNSNLWGALMWAQRTEFQSPEDDRHVAGGVSPRYQEKENRSPEAPEQTRRQRGPTESVALNMPCEHIRSRRSWLRAYALALICRPSASSAAPLALQGSISFSCVTGGSHLRLRLDEPPPAICLSSSGLSNSARCARGVETTPPYLSTV